MEVAGVAEAAGAAYEDEAAEVCDHLTEIQKKQYIEESKWAEDSPADSDSLEMFSFLCSVQCNRPDSGDGRRLAVITRLKKRLHSLLVAKASLTKSRITFVSLICAW